LSGPLGVAWVVRLALAWVVRLAAELLERELVGLPEAAELRFAAPEVAVDAFGWGLRWAGSSLLAAAMGREWGSRTQHVG